MKICDKILIFKLLTYNNFCDFCLQLALADWVEVKESLAIYKHLNLKRRVCEISTYFSHLLSHQACFTTVIYVIFGLYKITSISICHLAKDTNITNNIPQDIISKNHLRKLK